MSTNTEADLLKQKHLAEQFRKEFGDKLFSLSTETLKSRRNFLVASFIPVAFWVFGLEVQSASFLGLAVTGLTNAKLMTVVLCIGFYEGCMFYSRAYQDFCQWREKYSEKDVLYVGGGSQRQSVMKAIQGVLTQNTPYKDERLYQQIEKYSCIKLRSMFLNKWHTVLLELGVPVACFVAALVLNRSELLKYFS